VEFLSPPAGHRPIPALSLTNDVAVVTAVANDVSFDDVFLRQVIALGRPGDVVVGVSTSGNSENVLRGMHEARRRGMFTVGLAGYDGGRMAHDTALHHCFVVRSSSVHRIQEVQTTLYHVLWELVQRFMEEPACA
jgi:D-sedoheptulose 7-phosphate isomerase